MAEELFCKVVSIITKCRECEDRRSNVRLTVETHPSSNPVHKKDLIVRLSDDTDPFFLYNLTLGEEDFQSLKNQQGLLVEFSAFPQRFIDLLEQCISEQDKTLPRFLLQLVTSSNGLDCVSANLNIIETNPFKHLVHLSLKLLEGNDSDVKKYLANCIKSLKLENCVLKGKLQKSEEDFSEKLCVTQRSLSEKCKELDELKNECTTQTSLLTRRHTQEIAAEREKVLQIQTQYQLQSEQQKKELESSSNRTIQHLENRVSELETINKDLTERKYKSESHIRELKGKLAAVEEENHRTKQEIASLRRENATLDSECHEKEKHLNQYKMRAAVLEQEVKDKEQVVIRSTDASERAEEHRKKVEDLLEQKRLQTSKLETTVKTLSEELIKANEIIKKLQTDMKKLMEKMKLKNAVTMQQEKILGEKDQMLQKEQMELSNVKHTLQMKEEEVVKLQEQLDNTTEKLEESKQLLKTNENVISWLNKQLNENKMTTLQGPQAMYEMPVSVKTISPVSNLGTIQNSQLVKEEDTEGEEGGPFYTGAGVFFSFLVPGCMEVVNPRCADIKESRKTYYQPPYSTTNDHYFASAVSRPIGTSVASKYYPDNVVTPALRRHMPSTSSFASRLGPQVRFNINSTPDCGPPPEPRLMPPTSTPILPPPSCDPAGLDIKYLKRNGNVTTKVAKSGNAPSSVPVGPALTKSGSSPILSAYFPGQQPRLPAS